MNTRNICNHNINLWDDERTREEAILDGPMTETEIAAEASQARIDERTRLLTTPEGMAHLLNETINSVGGLESLAAELSALCRATSTDSRYRLNAGGRALAAINVSEALTQWANMLVDALPLYLQDQAS